MPADDPVARTIAILALIVSFASFLVSFGNLLWNIYVGNRDRVSVKLYVSPAFLQGGGRLKREGPFVGYQVMNIGRRTTTISEVGYLGPRGTRIRVEPLNPTPAVPPGIPVANLPIELKENEKTSYILPGSPLTEKDREVLGETPLAYALDAVGRTYTARMPQAALELIWPGGRYEPWWKLWAHHRWQWWRWKAA